jgi:hypothetical protein
MGMSIRIDGLTKRQKAMMQFIWSCRSESEFTSWYMTLPWNEQLIAESLMKLLQYESMESFLIGDYSEAKGLLSKFMLPKNNTGT